MKLQKTLLTIASVTLVSQNTLAARFSGGLCESQGNWLQTALQQSEVITSAIDSLRNDPNCKALVNALEKSPSVNPAQFSSADNESFSTLYSELSAISRFISPGKLGTNLPSEDLRKLLMKLVFSKSLDAIKDIQAQPDFRSLTEQQAGAIKDVSIQLKGFLKRSEMVASMAMSTTRNLAAALPASKLCLHNKPSTALVIFSSIVQTSASLVTSGRMNGVGEFLSSLINFSREMDYIKKLTPIEVARFQASVSCLVESTSNAYCDMGHAEEALDMFKSMSIQRKKLLEKAVANKEKDPVSNTMGGLVILMRDIPVIQSWMQRVLFGIEPRLTSDAAMKNESWASLVSFITSKNNLLANFNDGVDLYFKNASGRDRDAKLAQIKDIVTSLTTSMGVSTGFGRMQPQAGTNFFLKTMSPNLIPFYLIGVPSIPPDFNPLTSNFDQYWDRWAKEGSNGLGNPDTLVTTIKNQLNKIMSLANNEANGFFASRMVVDAQNLVTQAMRGPSASPYQGFIRLAYYFRNLADKIQSSSNKSMPGSEWLVRRKMLMAQVPLLLDSAKKAEKIVKALESISELSRGKDENEIKDINNEVMKIIVDAADMMLSRDSYFGNRMITAVQADLMDTLMSDKSLTTSQEELIYNLGADMVSELSKYMGADPNLQRSDISHAKLVQITNLKAVESVFARVMYNQILDLHCKVNGGPSCEYLNQDIDPVTDKSSVNMIGRHIEKTVTGGKGESNGWFWDIIRRTGQQPSEDSAAHRQVLAKLCIQSLTFESREAFVPLCKGTGLVSEFSISKDTEHLNMSYDEVSAKIGKIKSGNDAQKIDKVRHYGVCALHDYFMKNHIHHMFKEIE